MRIVYTESATTLENPIKIRIYEPVRYAEGGLHSHAEAVRQAGRFGDDVLLHVTPDEFNQLQQAWGDPTRNPVTGLPEYGFLSKIGNKLGKVAKKVIASPIVQKLGPIAASVFLPGVGGIIASAALKGVNAKLQGGKMSDVLKSAASGALMGGAAHMIPGLGGGEGSGPLSKMANFLPSSRGNDFSAPGSGGGANGALTPEDYVSGGGGGSSAGPMSKFLNFFKNDQGNPAWGKIAGASLGALALMKGINDQPSGKLGPQVQPRPEDLQHLQPKMLNRQVVGLPSAQDYYNYGQTGGEHNFFQPVQEARGGMPTRAAGHYIKGPGTGRSDEIDAKLSNDEYVMDAETVSLLGDGSPEEGARRLDQLRANLRKHKGQQLSKGKFSSNAKAPEEYLPKGTLPTKAKGGVFHPGEGMAAIRARRAAKGVFPQPSVDVPLQNKQRLIDVLEHRKLASPDISDADLSDISKWLDAIRNMPPPAEKAKGGRIPPVGPDLRALTGGVTKSPAQRAAELAAVQRFRDAIKSQQTMQKPAMPTQQQELLKFKRGGAITKLNDFADDLEEELNAENTERVAEIKSQMDTLHPGIGDFYASNMLRTGTE